MEFEGISAFYAARLDELEAKARAGRRLRPDVWHFEQQRATPFMPARYRKHPDEPWRWLTPEVEAEYFEPIKPDPYVLADIAAKRAVIAMAEEINGAGEIAYTDCNSLEIMSSAD